MSWLGNIFGVGTGNNNGAFQASGVTPGELSGSQGQVQAGLAQQQALTNQLAAQGGIQNQSNVYGQMQGLASQLQAQSQGQGPNPALAQLNQTTAANVAQQAALMAGQRGANSNPGLIARQAAQQGAATQQQAVGQAATMEAQQQLAAENALQSQQANLANLATTQVGQQVGAVGNYNQFALGNQGQLLGGQANQNTVNAGIAQGNQKAGAGLIGGVLGGVGQASLARGGMVRRFAGGGNVNPVSVPSGSGVDPNGPRSYAGQYLSGTGAPPPPSSSGDGFSQTGVGLGVLARRGINALFSKSGAVNTPQSSGMPSSQDWYDYSTNKSGLPTDEQTYEMYQSLPDAGAASSGAEAADAAEGAEAAGAAGETAEAGDALEVLVYKGGKIERVHHYDLGGLTSHLDAGNQGGILDDIMSYLAKGGQVTKVPARVSPGEKYLTPKVAKKVAAGKTSPMEGKTIPGKAKVKGDSAKNDTVKMTLDEGGVVIPRSVLQSKDAAEKAKKFVQAVMAKQSMKRAA